METCVKEHSAEAVLSEQFGYAARVNEIINNKYNRKPLAYVHTFGCQQNVSDSERLKGLLDLMGYGFTDEITEADLVLYNTCAVREHAEDRVFGNVGILKALKKDPILRYQTATEFLKDLKTGIFSVN